MPCTANVSRAKGFWRGWARTTPGNCSFFSVFLNLKDFCRFLTDFSQLYLLHWGFRNCSACQRLYDLNTFASIDALHRYLHRTHDHAWNNAEHHVYHYVLDMLVPQSVPGRPQSVPQSVPGSVLGSVRESATTMGMASRVMALDLLVSRLFVLPYV